MLDIIPCVIFTKGGHIVKHRTIRKHSFQPNCIRVQRVMPNEIDTTSIGAQVSSDLACTSSSDIQGHGVTTLAHVILADFEDAATLCTENPVRVVKAQYSIHARHGEYDLIIDRVGPSDQSSVPALWNYC